MPQEIVVRWDDVASGGAPQYRELIAHRAAWPEIAVLVLMPHSAPPTISAAELRIHSTLASAPVATITAGIDSDEPRIRVPAPSIAPAPGVYWYWLVAVVDGRGAALLHGPLIVV